MKTRCDRDAGDRLTRLMHANHVRSRELACMLRETMPSRPGLTENHVNSWRAGFDPMPLDVIPVIASLMNTTPEYLAGWKDEPRDRELERVEDVLVKEYDLPKATAHSIAVVAKQRKAIVVTPAENTKVALLEANRLYRYLKQQFGAADEPAFDPFFKQVWEVDLSGGARL